MEERNAGFILSEEDLSKTQRLSDGDFREWVTACVHYCSRGEVPDEKAISALALAIFDFTIPRMNEYLQRWDRRVVANRENGKKGGRPRKQDITESETQTNPENPMVFLETHCNPENPVAPNTNTNSNTSTISISIPNSTLEEGMEVGDNRGSRGEEEPVTTVETIMSPKYQKLQSGNTPDAELTIVTEYQTGVRWVTENGRHVRKATEEEAARFDQRQKQKQLDLVTMMEAMR